MGSSFLSPGPVAREYDLASLHLRRDASLPVVLSTTVASAQDEGYAEGMVTNTRFGSFPHSTIIGQPWGSQIRASIVDTGSRGRKEQKNAKKRKAADALDQADQADQDGDQSVGGDVAVKDPVFASSGFVHVLPPTPENWTVSLPHRTQVVYTPDYSYVLHRMAVRPGSRLIEAGSGSGSFTHAAARAVFNGHPRCAVTTESDVGGGEQNGAEERGKVFSFEFHQERHAKVKVEMEQHGLHDIVIASHRDVYKDGFLVHDELEGTKTSPRATSVFLDLPAPWEAIPHLTRQPEDGTVSALDPGSPVHICTFSPCMEQVQKTIVALRKHDWLDIETVEVQHKRIEVRRDYTGLQYEGMRGVNGVAADVEDALVRLRMVEKRAKDFHSGSVEEGTSLKAMRQQKQQQDPTRLDPRGGKLIHRTEAELKTHTSYLTFAVLPRAWSEGDEAAMQAKWSKHVNVSSNVPKSQRQLKKEAKQRTKGQNGVKHAAEGGDKVESMTEGAAE